ncbi:karyopherin [Cladophialophora chaetospira]|uniref:Karyopherin n=1 Tax=Cladophialophora chaetospira TaxID=386627 RepID=A0AA39CK61_9EURO|nr:karyopherin [Cladophialophora chaetospira]
MAADKQSTPNRINRGDQSYDRTNILEALQLIHAPTTPNAFRKKASDYLEGLKGDSETAFEVGFSLSTETSAPPLVQHFGLSLLSHVIRHGAHQLDDQQNSQLRDCVLHLGRMIRPEYQLFVRNKIAELWIELAKRSWALDWFDLDEQLVRLWSQDLVHKDFVLTILENLSEDTFARDDSIAIMRGRDLNSALVEIFTSTSNYSGGIKIGGTTHNLRFGDEGWLVRITKLLNDSGGNSDVGGPMREALLKALATLRSAFVWVMTPAISQSQALAATCNFLTSSDTEFVTAALDALLSVYSRIRLEELEVQALVFPLIHADGIEMLRGLYNRSMVSADDLDNPIYVVSKKLSELLSLFGDHICHYSPPTAAGLDPAPFLELITDVLQNTSLIVSIPVVHAWVKILEVQSWRSTPAVWACIDRLLQVVSARLIQYDQFPDAVRNPVAMFVNEEIELFPERQGFYLNYRRLCAAVVEWICFAAPEEAMIASLKGVNGRLDTIESVDQQTDIARYERVSMQILEADAVFSWIDAAFKGFDRLQDDIRERMTSEQEHLLRRMRENISAWMLNTMTKRNFKDPQIRQRLIKTAVEASYRVLQKDTGFAFSVLEHILSSFIADSQQNSLYAEAVDDLHGYATAELRRLSLQHADYFVTFYDQLNSKFQDLLGQIGANDRLKIDLKSILFSVIQRATSIDPAQRQAKLKEFLQPISDAWAEPDLKATLFSLESFAHSQAFDQVGPYMASLQADKIEDWSFMQYDNRGVQIQQEMAAGYSRLPLRESRILLSISTEKLEQGSDLHDMICNLWSPMVPTMLEYVLRLTSYNHQLHNPSTWPNVPPEREVIIRRVLRDRYWQSGISSGSMGEFHSKVKATKASLEGFASSVRGRIRNNLEQCYSILHTLGRLGPAFYNLPQLPELIAQAAIDTATPLSPHHLSVMLQMLPKLIDECPPESRQHFLTPIIGSLLVQLDVKLSREWEKMDEIKQTKQDDENLGDEMRDDSVLRQTTYKGVNLVAHWLNPKREQQLSTKKSIVNGYYLKETSQQTMREFVLGNVQILEKLLIFITHAMAFKDMKSGYTILMAAQRLVPDFVTEHFLPNDQAAAVREYISNDMLKSAITCLHNGYFADQQQYYAQLIATIWLSYGLPMHVPAAEGVPPHDRPALTSTPRDVILSLPGMSEAKADKASEQLLKEGGPGGSRSKKLRAIILTLLEGVRGVRISELGKIDTKQQQSKLLEKYKQREILGMQGVQENGQEQQANGPEVDLGGVADMFAT